MENQSRSERLYQIIEEMCASGEITAEYQEKWLREHIEAVIISLKSFAKHRPEIAIEVLSTVIPEERLRSMNIEKFVSSITPDFLLAGMTTEEKQQLLRRFLRR